jgi:hypothetical protein
MFYDKRHSHEVQEWCYRMMNDPNQWEKWRYIDTLYDYNNIIAELQKLYEQTPVTNRFIRARCLNGIKRTHRELAKTQSAYEYFGNTRRELQ